MALQGFDANYYLGAKLAELQATESEWVGKDTTFLATVLSNVYGLTAEEHYAQYGFSEGLAPNAYFNAAEYKLAKAVSLFDTGNYLTVEAALAAFEAAWTGDSYLHYLQFGGPEGINPSNDFDASQYWDDKLALLQSDSATATEWASNTAADVKAAFDAAGHYILFGEAEGLTVTVVPADEQVSAGDSTPTAGTTFTLTTGIDDVVGGTGNDTITGVLSGTADNVTFSGLDTIDGGDGTDTLNILDETGGQTFPTTLTMSNVENVVIRSVGAASVDASSWADVTSLSVTQAAAVALVGSSTAAVSVSGATGALNIDGGLTQTITTAGGNVDSDDAAGAVTVTHTATAGQAIAVDDGTDVTVTASGITTGGSIVIGAADEASGAVQVTATGKAYAIADANHAMGTVAVTGGASVTVAQTATSDDALVVADTSAITVTQGAVTVTADDNTTTVALTQEDQVTAVSGQAAVAAVSGTKTVTFTAMASADVTTVDGLVFTASKALTADEVASAFSNLTAADRQSAGGTTDNGIFTVVSASNYTTGAATGAVVTYTEVVAGTANAFTATNGGANANPAIAAGVTGVAVTPAITGVMGVGAGAVIVDDNATKSITTVTVDGASTVVLGGAAASGKDLDALTDLSLANVTGATDLNSTATSLNLTVNDVVGAVDLGITADTITTLNIASETTASVFALEADNVTTLTVDAAVNLDLSSSTFGSLETVDVNGAGSVDLDDLKVEAGLDSFDASGNTGGVTVDIDANAANVGDITEFVLSAGNDVVGVFNDLIDVDITLGAGNDSLTLNADSTVAVAGTVTGGAGTADTVSMTIASAEGYDNNTNFATAVTGFERLVISDAVGTDENDGAGGAGANTVTTIDLEALGFGYVTTSGTTADTVTADSDSLLLDNMTSGDTVVLTANGIIAAQLDVATATDDVLNVVTKVVQGNVDAGTLAVADVETINITADDTDADHDSDGILFEAGERQLSTLDLNATSATSVVIDGDANLTLDMTGNTLVAVIDASALTGALTVTAIGTATVTGGAGDDALTAAGSGDTLLGGAGADTLTGADLTTLTGGAGSDIFVVSIPTNVNTYSTITDLSSGDIIALTAGETFVSSAVTLASTAVFQDYANAAVNELATDNEDAAWFQFGDDTFIVINDNQADAVDADFENGSDAIIRITGTVDLSTASYNLTTGTLEIA